MATITGDNGDNVLSSTSGDDQIFGSSGNDTLNRGSSGVPENCRSPQVSVRVKGNRLLKNHRLKKAMCVLPLAGALAWAVVPAGAWSDLTTFTVRDQTNKFSVRTAFIDENGMVAGDWRSQENGQIQGAYVRTPAGTVSTIHVPGSSFPPDAVAIENGVVIGDYLDGFNVLRVFIRPQVGEITTFGVPGATSTYPASIGGGAILGTFTDSAHKAHWFIRSPSGDVTQFDTPGKTVAPTDGQINSAGVAMGDYAKAGGYVGFIRAVDGTLTSFAVPGALVTVPAAINTAGVIVGVSRDSSGNVNGFVRAADGTFTTLQFPGAVFTRPVAINSVGEIVGTYSLTGSDSHAFVRSASGKFSTVEMARVSGTNPMSINSHAVTTGNYQAVKPADDLRGFVWTLR